MQLWPSSAASSSCWNAKLDDGWPESGEVVLKEKKIQRCKKRKRRDEDDEDDEDDDDDDDEDDDGDDEDDIKDKYLQTIFWEEPFEGALGNK